MSNSFIITLSADEQKMKGTNIMSREVHKEYRLEDGTKYYFNNIHFAKIIREICRDTEDGMIRSKQELLEDIAEETGISASSMNHWIMGHNAPSDFEKIKSVADALKVDICDLVEKEENSTSKTMKEETIMNSNENKVIEATVVMPAPASICDYSDTKSVLREIFMQISEYIETFRITLGFNYDEIGEEFDMFYSGEKFSEIYGLIRKRMLDLPMDLYKELLLFCKGYLADMMGDEYDPVDIWDIRTASDEELIEKGFDISKMNPYSRQFVGYKNFTENYEEKYGHIQIEYIEMISDKAYEILEELLKDYLIK